MCGKFTQMYAGELVTATPMCFAKVMRLDWAGARELIPMRWGFAGKDDAAPTRPKHMHARCETIDGKPTFTQAFAHARGILMVHTFNEGEELPSGKTKQWVIAPRDGQPIAIAVICEQWNNDTETLQTFVQVTTPANALISRITDRMPAILPRDTWAAWLGETAVPLTEVKALLRTFEDGGNWTLTEQEPKSPVRTPKPPETDAQQSLF